LVMNLTVISWWNIKTLMSIPSSTWVSRNTEATQKWLLINQFLGVFLDGDLRVNYEVMLAFLELAILVYYLCPVVHCSYQIVFRKGVERWHGIAVLLWDTIPELSTFSAMKSLHYVTPKVLARDFTYKVRRCMAPKAAHGDYLALAIFVLGRLVRFFVGFEAFMVKFTIASNTVSTGTDWLGVLFAALSFLNQVLGVVNVHQFSRRRLFVLIFGGEDGFMSRREEMVAATWLGMLAERMWLHAGTKSPQIAWFLALALSYGDSDFQRLVLNEEAKKLRIPKAAAKPA